jgi:flagellar hook-basal body complex protein FliE
MAIPIQGVTSIAPSTAGTKLAETSPASAGEFWDTLKQTLDQVQKVQNEADQKVSELLTGGGEDIHTAMTAVARADLAFELVMQVRNKIVQAYQQVSQIQF